MNGGSRVPIKLYLKQQSADPCFKCFYDIHNFSKTVSQKFYKWQENSDFLIRQKSPSFIFHNREKKKISLHSVVKRCLTNIPRVLCVKCVKPKKKKETTSSHFKRI